jgi:hypothetical protein
MTVRIEHRIGIAAPADVIWELISNIEGYAAWNPLYTEGRGKLAIGQTLQLTENIDGRQPRQITPVIVDWEPRAQILWRQNDGLMSRTVRYIEIETLTETGCIFANGAFFHGMLGEQKAKSDRGVIFRGYEQFGETVKRLSEERWREQAAAAQ